jgi:Tfp pilus assembly protein PilF/thiol-disulfide isomerase/thioredoxin
VASQSPTEILAGTPSGGQAESYVRAWQATTELLRLGHNWSGHEANVCFLNTHSPRFVDVSSVSGFDSLDDARGVAVADWDRDGDLDLWLTSRTSPRVTFLQNQASAENQFVAVRLRGVTCNRDAIGARIEVHRGPDPSDAIIQTLRAGEGYLAQSSKTVHFGLGRDPRIEKVVVRWPGGESEEFKGVTAGGCFELVQGEGNARKVDRQQPPGGLAIGARPPAPQSGASARIKAARRLPLPPLEGTSATGERWRLDESLRGPRLILLWAPWCQPCLVELGELAENASRWQAAGLTIVPVNVDSAQPDSATPPADSAEVLVRLGFKESAALATPELLDRLDIAQRVLTNKPFPPPIPSSFLLDRAGRLVCVYKGPVGIDQLLDDVEDLDATTADPRDAALPFPGRWYTQPFPPDLLAIPKRLMQVGQPQAALAYLEDIAAKPDGDGAEFVRLFANDLAATYIQLARLFSTEEKFEHALAALEAAVKHQQESWDAHFGLAAIYGRLGRQREAAQQYRVLLQLRPGEPLVSRNLAWLLATSEDPVLRDPTEAIRLAQQACEASQYQSPAALDALAAAYAAAGRFDQATATARRAMEILTETGQPAAAKTIEGRLRMYEQHQALGAKPVGPDRD